MIKVRFHQIDYDIDHNDHAAKDLDLPKEITAEFDDCFDPAMEGADFISDETGFCVNGFKFDVKKVFRVSVPVLVDLSVEVEASCKAEAIDRVLDELSFNCEFTCENKDMKVEVNQAECYRELMRGNVYAGHINQISAERV